MVWCCACGSLFWVPPHHSLKSIGEKQKFCEIENCLFTPLIWKSCLLTIYYLPACYLPTTIIYLRYSIKSLEWIKTWFYHFQYLFNGQRRIRKFAFSNCAWNKQHIEKFFFQFDSGPAPGFSNQKIVVSIFAATNQRRL